VVKNRAAGQQYLSLLGGGEGMPRNTDCSGLDRGLDIWMGPKLKLKLKRSLLVATTAKQSTGRPLIFFF
jgi:hypothetical protein